MLKLFQKKILIMMTRYYIKFRTEMLGVLSVLLLTIVGCGGSDPAPDAVATFDFEATTNILGQAPLNVQFENSSTNAVSYAWDFGDGNSSTDESPLHVYSSGGIYTVTLTVKNADEREFTDVAELTLSSPLVGTWQLDSAAASTIDTLTVLGAFEVGVSRTGAPCPATGNDATTWDGWNGTGWTHIFTDEEPYGHSTFWSGFIFAGNYFGRTDFFENEFTFSVDGGYEVDLKGELRFPDFIVAVEDDFDEADNWVNADGVDINAWKSSSTYTYSVTESPIFTNQGALKLNGNGAFLGTYFAGVTGSGSHKVPQAEYNFTIAKVTNDQLVVFGYTADLLCASDLMVLKFKKVN